MTPSIHRFDIQVRFGDTDALGHVNNASYATYTESARLAYFQALAPEAAGLVNRSVGSLPTRQGEPSLGVILAHLSIDFRRQVTYGDAVHVETSVAAIGRKSITLSQVIYANGATAAEVRAVLAIFDYAAQATRELPAELRRRLERASGAEPGAAAGPEGRG